MCMTEGLSVPSHSPMRSVPTFKAHQYLYVVLMSCSAFAEEHFPRQTSVACHYQKLWRESTYGSRINHSRIRKE